jgi:Malate/L-lactate dehydrogenase
VTRSRTVSNWPEQHLQLIESTMSQTDAVRMSLDEVRDLARRILSHYGLAPDHVAAVAETIGASERDGCTSHGVYRLIVCARTLASGNVIRDAVPEVSNTALKALVHMRLDPIDWRQIGFIGSAMYVSDCSTP